MNQILDITGKPLRPRKARKQHIKKQDLRDLGKIATVLAIIGVGYFQFAPEGSESGGQSVAMARR